MKYKTPMVSIVMSVYNAQNYLDEAIESMLSQTYENFEFIIINDGSNDGSLEIIEKYKKQDARIILLSRENRGLIASLNEGIKIAKGTYIARMDADDISLPQRLFEQVNFMLYHPNVGVCGSWIEGFGDDVALMIGRYSTSNARLKTELLFSSCFAHPSVMIEKKLLLDFNLLYDEEFLYVEDFELWSRLANKTDFANIQKVLLKYRIVKTSVTRIADEDIKQRYDVMSKIFDKYFKKLKIHNTEEENRLHFNLSVNTRIRDNNLSFKKLENYFDTLTIANNQMRVFNRQELKKVLGKKWLWNFVYKKEIKSIFSKYFFYGIWSIVTK